MFSVQILYNKSMFPYKYVVNWRIENKFTATENTKERIK